MADYIYLLEHRLSPTQRVALRLIADIARAKGLNVFLVGDAVRDLTSGSPVRDIEVVVQGNALELRQDLEEAGAVITGEVPDGQALFTRFAGGLRVEVGSTLSIQYPKPGVPVRTAATILEDLRRRDFTANAMALSLNAGSYGLLMDPLNGVADIENRQLRLVSNYGFIENPISLVRAARLMARLGWNLEEKTATRYETAKEEGYIQAISAFERGFETEHLIHEEDPLRVLGRLESEGWMAHLAPFWTTSKVNVAELDRLREVERQLEMNGIHADLSAASFPLLTARLSAGEVAELKQMFPRKGFVTEIESLEAQAKDLAGQLTGKSAAAPSQVWKLLHAAAPEAVLWLSFASKSPVIQGKFKSFQTEWPQARQKIPFTLLQEMRIVPELPGYEDLLETLFFAFMDGRLEDSDELKAFLEPYSPPAPPPPVSARKPRAAKKEIKAAKTRTKKVIEPEDEPDQQLDALAEEIVEGFVEPTPTPGNVGAASQIAEVESAVTEQPAPEADPEIASEDQRPQAAQKALKAGSGVTGNKTIRRLKAPVPLPPPASPAKIASPAKTPKKSAAAVEAIPSKRPTAASKSAPVAAAKQVAVPAAKQSRPATAAPKKLTSPAVKVAVKAATAKSAAPKPPAKVSGKAPIKVVGKAAGKVILPAKSAPVLQGKGKKAAPSKAANAAVRKPSEDTPKKGAVSKPIKTAPAKATKTPARAGKSAARVSPTRANTTSARRK